MTDYSRRKFFSYVSAIGATTLLSHTALAVSDKTVHIKEGGSFPFSFGLASYSTRKFSLEKTIEYAKKSQMVNLSLKSMHLPLESSAEQISTALTKIKEAGCVLNSVGVVYMNTEEEIDKAFAYAKLAGVKTIISVPDPELLKKAEEKAIAYDIRVAIHNHGPEDKKFPSPQSIYDKVKTMDKRMGICMDIGHTERLGLNPASELKKYFDRMFDIHIKDETASNAEGKTVEIGRGVIKMNEFLKACVKLKYANCLTFEFEKDEEDPFPGLSESFGFVKGLLSTI